MHVHYFQTMLVIMFWHARRVIISVPSTQHRKRNTDGCLSRTARVGSGFTQWLTSPDVASRWGAPPGWNPRTMWQSTRLPLDYICSFIFLCLHPQASWSTFIQETSSPQDRLTKHQLPWPHFCSLTYPAPFPTPSPSTTHSPLPSPSSPQAGWLTQNNEKL